MVWQTGHSVYSDRYRIEKVLGQGGFGIAYLGRDRQGRKVVIKTLKDEVLCDSRNKYFCERFKDEALKLAVCRHPHIVSVQNTFTEPYTIAVNGKKQQISAFCLVMEFVDGHNLEELVMRQGPLPEALALTYINQIGSALSSIHDLGVIHRDIKPNNIIIRKDRHEAVLIDFGLARNFERDSEKDYTVALTHGYAPPEQYSRKIVASEALDIYALAGTLYFILTKRLPVPAMDRMLSAPMPPVTKFNPQLNSQINVAIDRGMALKIEQRPSSVEEWLALLPPVSDQSLPTPPAQSAIAKEKVKSDAVARGESLILDIIDPELVHHPVPIQPQQVEPVLIAAELEFGGLTKDTESDDELTLLDFDYHSSPQAKSIPPKPQPTLPKSTPAPPPSPAKPSSGMNWERISKNPKFTDAVFSLQSHEPQTISRIKKLCFVICTGNFPSSSQSLDNVKLSALLLKVLQKHTTYEQLQTAVNSFVQNLSKPITYSSIARLLLKATESLYPPENL
jgi:serine/threonine protein kinase